MHSAARPDQGMRAMNATVRPRSQRTAQVSLLAVSAIVMAVAISGCLHKEPVEPPVWTPGDYWEYINQDTGPAVLLKRQVEAIESMNDRPAYRLAETVDDLDSGIYGYTTRSWIDTETLAILRYELGGTELILIGCPGIFPLQDEEVTCDVGTVSVGTAPVQYVKTVSESGRVQLDIGTLSLVSVVLQVENAEPQMYRYSPEVGNNAVLPYQGREMVLVDWYSAKAPKRTPTG